MSRKIIGVTVGTQLPKPNFKQTDPTKGDYIKNKPVGIEGQVVGFNENGNMVAMDSLQPDWNQTDENAADFIKNKPDVAGAANTALESAKSYTDTKVADLVNSAPETLDTLGELATAMETNSGVVETLNSAITTKANASDLTAHTGNKSNPHNVTAAQVGAVSYSAQTLTDAQKAQVRSNIGILQADWNQTDETAMDFILNKPEAITDEEIDAICGGVETIDITENVLTDTATGLVYRIYVTDGKLSMKEISGVTGTEDLVFVDTYTDAVYKVYVENGKLNMTEVE